MLFVKLTQGSVYYEVECKDEGLSRFGFGTTDADLNLGTCPEGFGFGGTGKKSNRRQFDEYGESFGQHDIIGMGLISLSHFNSISLLATLLILI